MFSGEIGSLQPRTSYALALAVGSREMAQHSPACCAAMWETALWLPDSVVLSVYLARSALPRDRFRSLSSRPEDFHLRALPEPYVNLSIHTAAIVRPLPWHNDQWAKSFGFSRRNRSNQSLAPLV
jgi:hypothetical protein